MTLKMGKSFKSQVTNPLQTKSAYSPPPVFNLAHCLHHCFFDPQSSKFQNRFNRTYSTDYVSKALDSINKGA